MTSKGRKASKGRYCCVPYCNSSGMRCKGQVSFFKFPSDNKLRNMWVKKIGRLPGETFSIGDFTVVCSKHFKEDDMITQGGDTLKRRVLKPSAVPSVFNFPNSAPDRQSRKIWIQEDAHQLEKAENITMEDEVTTIEIDPSYISETTREKELNRNLQNALEAIALQKAHILELKSKPEIKSFCFEMYAKNPSAMHHFTGFSSCQKFERFYKFLEPQSENMKYWKEGKTVNCNSTTSNGSKKTERVIDKRNEFFLTMVRLRRGWSEKDLAILFDISVTTVNTILITWINLLYFVLGSLPIWPSKKIIQKHIPEKYKQKHPNFRAIIDVTELFVEPSCASPLQSLKTSHQSFKSLIGIAPDKSIIFISQLFEEPISDTEVVIKSGLVDLVQPGDEIMSCKRFNIPCELESKGITFIMPRMEDGCNRKRSKTDVLKTKEAAHLRAIVDNVISNITSFHVLTPAIPSALSDVATQLWVVCALLCNCL